MPCGGKRMQIDRGTRKNLPRRSQRSRAQLSADPQQPHIARSPDRQIARSPNRQIAEIQLHCFQWPNRPSTFVRPREPKPEWLKVRAPGSENYLRLRGIMRDLKLNTVCEDAHCPNIGECWHHGTATFMILGDVCTRACTYCAVAHGKPTTLDIDEPRRVAEAVETMALKYAVDHLGRSRRSAGRRRRDLRGDDPRDHARACPTCRVEVLIPDFKGEAAPLRDRARRAARRAQPQHRDRAAAVPDGALGRQVLAHAGAARSRAPPSRRTSRPRPA